MPHYTLTLNGNPQNLATAIAAGDFGVRRLDFTADEANTHVVKGGGSASLTVNDWGFYIPIPVTNIPAAPYRHVDLTTGPVPIGSIWVIGTLNEKLHLWYDLVIP